MRIRLLGIVGGALAGVGIAACVGDSPIGNPAPDGGVDGAPDSQIPIDGSTTDAADAGPLVDGSYAFASNWPTYTNTGTGAESVAALPSGGFAIVGSYTGSNALIGSYPLPPAAGSRDAYVATLDSAGKVTAALGFGGPGADNALSVAVDATGDIYVTGISLGGLTLNSAVLATGTFIAKLDGKSLSAAPKWTRSFELTAPCKSCLAVRGADLDFGSTFGAFAPSTVHYDTNKTVTTNGGPDMLFVKMDPSTGSVKWGGQIGGAGVDTVEGIAIDNALNLYIVGDYQSSALVSGQALGAKTPTGPGSAYNLLVAKLDASQAPVYANAYGDPGGAATVGGGIATDGAGRVALVGSFNGGVDFGMGPTGASSTDAFLFVIDETKNKTVWQQVIGDSGNEHGSAVAFDGWGHLLVTGQYQNAPQLGSIKLPPAGPLGAFVAKFGPSYAVEWFHGLPELGSTGSVGSSDLAVAPSGTCLICGQLAGSTDFGNGVVNAISTGGTGDSYVAGRYP